MNKEVSAAPLIGFKLIFGALMVFSTLRFMYLGWIEDHYINPIFHFKYWGFEWVEPVSLKLMYGIHILMVIAAFGIMFLRGTAYTLSAIVLFLSFTYTELIDLTYYLNHYYFVSLICLLMIFMPNKISAFHDLETQKVKRIFIFTIQFQIALLYVYAGLAKINYDWLIEALPLKIWVPANDKIPFIGPIFSFELSPYLFSWAGMLFDTFIIFFLINKTTRFWAYLVVIVFHTITGIMFQIGVFPLVMIGIVTVFFSDEWHKKFIQTCIRIKKRKALNLASYNLNKYMIFPFVLYLVFQLVFPWRYLLYPGNLFWTEEGYRFSWRVMLMEKAGTATFYVKDTQTGREGIVVNSEFLNPHQEKQMAMQPDMILQFAHFLGEHYAQLGVHNPEVRAEVYVTLNARPSRLYIDPNRNLMNEKDTFKPKDWIIHYTD